MAGAATPPPLRVRPYGANAALVDVGDPLHAAALALWLRGRVAAADVVPAARSVLVDGVSAAAVEVALAAWTPATTSTSGASVELAVTYNGPDLDFAAAAWGVAPGSVGDVLSEVELVSTFCGFSPGFAYLAGLPRELWLPRLDTPRPRVDAGSVAIGGEWCGVYPSPSPGGWRLLGRTEAVLWDAGRSEPALLVPGTRVRLVTA